MTHGELLDIRLNIITLRCEDIIRFPRNHETNKRTLSYTSDVVTRAKSKVSYRRVLPGSTLPRRLKSSQGFNLTNHVRLHTRDRSINAFPFRKYMPLRLHEILEEEYVTRETVL